MALQSDLGRLETTPAWLWRLSSKHGSKGVLGDVGVHVFDFASLPVGPIRSIHARLKTSTKLKGKRAGEYPLDACFESNKLGQAVRI